MYFRHKSTLLHPLFPSLNPSFHFYFHSPSSPAKMMELSEAQMGDPSKPKILPSGEAALSTLTIVSRPELADNFSHLSTAEIAANSPRYRRKSSTFIDGVHDLSDDKQTMAPAQLYSTMSGRLFHSGRIAIVLVGPPARGKT
jgi:hypothetical protein